MGGFLADCNQLFLALIGVDFFILLERGIFLAQMNSLDVSIFLKTDQNWEEVVRRCNAEVGIVFQKEAVRDIRQYYCPVFCERTEWEQKYKLE